MELAPARHLEAVGRLRLLDDEPDIHLELFVQALTNVARCHVLPDFPRKRRRVYHEVHGKRRLLNMDHLHRVRPLEVCYRLSYRNIRNTGDNDDVAALRFLDRRPLQPSVNKDLIYLSLLDHAVTFRHANDLGLFQSPFRYAADPESSDIVVVRESRDLHLERLVS